MQRVQEHERGDEAGGLRGLEVGRDEGDVHAPDQLALGSGVSPLRQGENYDGEQGGDDGGQTGATDHDSSEGLRVLRDAGRC